MKEIWTFLPESAEAFFLSTEDEFLNEYTPEYNQRLKFLTGFTGSYAFYIMQKTGENFLFVDGRYTLQAYQEVYNNISIKGIEELNFFLISLNKEIWFDGKNHSYKFIKNLTDKGVKLKDTLENPIDKIWKRKVTASREASETFNFKLAGESVQSKLNKVYKYLELYKVDALFIFDITDTSWLFNIRGKFLQNTPTVPFFGIVNNVSRETSFSASAAHEYKLLTLDDIKDIEAKKILVPNKISYFIYSQLSLKMEVIFEKEDFIASLKMIKTESEIECIKKAHEEDAKALKEFAEFLKILVSREAIFHASAITEFTLGQKLLEFRKNQQGFIAESFPAILGFKENGAIVHYRAKEDSAKEIKGEGVLLVDSGGQYYNEELKIAGTTDVTRTFYIGNNPSTKQKRIYTLVLKGHIAIAKAVFPEGTVGTSLDVLARQFLWSEGLNYNHGTGHGVGFFLSVHEVGGFSKNSQMPLKAGMILSNEPGCYLENEFGIRFESLMLVKKAEREGFLCFEILTKAEVEAKLLDFEILTDDELEFLKENY